MTEVIHYRNYEIRYWMKPVPVRDWDWDWHHKDFDLDDHRYGHSKTLEDAKADIDEQIEEMSDDELAGMQKMQKEKSI
jgi:hypothetical protein